MAGFRKAKPQQAYLKLGFYGPPGSGKTLTALLVAEGLAGRVGKRVAYADTERGTDFYSQAVAERRVHPGAFDFDALYTRSVTELLREARGLDTDVHGVLVVDSITHIWEACKLAYSGHLTRAGTIPFQAWGAIKKPYRDLMSLLLSMPAHVIFCGREGTEYGEDDKTGELKQLGKKMKAETETPYEPHILLRMEAAKAGTKHAAHTVRAIVEKDRTGILAGKVLPDPDFDAIARPLLGLLGDVQAAVPTEDETAAKDAEALDRERQQRERDSGDLKTYYVGRFLSGRTDVEVEAVAKELTPALKKKLLAADLAEVREKYREASARVKGAAVTPPPREPGDEPEE